MRLILSLLLLLFLQYTSVGQFNIKVGYSLAFCSAEENNKILQAFNEEYKDILEAKLSNLNSLHGIIVGARYKFGINQVELSWEHLSRKKQGVGEFSDMSLFQQDLYYSFSQLLFNYETSFGMIGIGTGVGFNNVKIKDRISSSEVKKTLISGYQGIARITLSINFPGENLVRVSLKPFIQFPLGDLNLQSLADELGVSNVEHQNESFPLIGIGFIFYNGR